MSYRLPKAFITTVVGSYPKMPEASEAIKLRKRGAIDEREFHRRVRPAIEAAVRDQLEAGIDIVSDGEQSREDMVVYFAERLRGYEIGDWVRIFDNVYFRKPVVVGEIEFVEPMTVEDWEYATSVAQGHPVKVTITGPYTMADWSFDQHYGDRAELVMALARALRREIEELVKRGARIIQIDEPALSTRPFREEVELVKEALEKMFSGIEVEKRIVHICFGRIEKVLPYLLELPVDQLDFEFKNSNFRLLPYLKEYGFNKELGYGVVDVHSLRVETPQEIVEDVERLMRLDIVGPEKVYLDPDCGLKRLPREVAKAKMRSIAEAARELRRRYGYE